MREQNDKTKLRTMSLQLKRCIQERVEASAQAAHYRQRATTAEQAASEWKARFDKLLEKWGTPDPVSTQ